MKNQATDNRIIPLYVIGSLKHLMHLTSVFKTFDVWPKKLNHVFNDNKIYFLDIQNNLIFWNNSKKKITY